MGTLVGYHGSPKPIERFDLDHMEHNTVYGPGIYFAATYKEALTYAGPDGVIYECQLRLDNPLELDAKSGGYKLVGITGETRKTVLMALSPYNFDDIDRPHKNLQDWKQAIATLQGLGYDGAVVEFGPEWAYYIVYSPDQIISKKRIDAATAMDIMAACIMRLT